MVKGSPEGGMETPIKSGATYTREEVIAMLAATKKATEGAANKPPREDTWKPVKSRVTIKKERMAC